MGIVQNATYRAKRLTTLASSCNHIALQYPRQSAAPL
jgi:hypothetical protein